MTSRWRPGPEHRSEATQRLVSGLTRGDDVFELAKAIADLHPKDSTFPGEVFISVAVDALDAAGIDRYAPLLYEGLPDKYLAECRLRGPRPLPDPKLQDHLGTMPSPVAPFRPVLERRVLG